MHILNEEEQLKLTGGAIKTATLLGLGALGVLIIGIVDGFFRPTRCN